MEQDRGILDVAFGSERWRSAAEALFEATGLSLTVMDMHACSVIHAVNHCPYCALAVRRVEGDQALCFDDPPRFSAKGTTEASCRAGLPCYITPISVDGRVVCTVVIGGFVSSTRERKRLFEKLLAKGVDETIAREGVREIPIVPKRQVEALQRLVVANATDAVERASERERLEQAVYELEVFAEAGREFTERRGIGQALLDGVLERAMAVARAQTGLLMLRRSGTDMLEVVAPRTPAQSATRGRMVHDGEGIAGRVALNAHSMLVSGDDELIGREGLGQTDVTSVVSVPLMRGGEVLGVLDLGILDPARRPTGDDVRLIERYAHMAAVTIDNARRHRATERAMFELMHLSELAKMVSGISGTDEVISTANSVLEKAFGSEIGGIAIIGWGRDEAAVTVHGTVERPAIEHVLSVAVGRDLDSEPLAAMTLVTHLGEIVDTGAFDPDSWNVLPVELVANGCVVGYLFVAGQGGGGFDADDRRLLAGLADHLAVAVEKTSMLERMRDDLTKTIAALSATLDAGEYSSPGHSDRVTDYAVALAEELGLGVEQVEVLRFAGLLHDTGPSGLTEEIILKPTSALRPVRDRQTVPEPTIAEQIAFLNAVAPVIMHHHEHWDGTGHPLRLAGEDIPFLARVLALADSFDVMTSQRPGRPRMTFAEARRALEGAAGTQFDPALVEVFLSALDRRALAGATGLFAGDGNDVHLPA